MGYLKRDDENQAAFDNQGYFHTGDLGFLDKEGRL
jgi:long-subunit acyl-CoA synthetase (AMP-forming)